MSVTWFDVVCSTASWCVSILFSIVVNLLCIIHLVCSPSHNFLTNSCRRQLDCIVTVVSYSTRDEWVRSGEEEKKKIAQKICVVAVDYAIEHRRTWFSFSVRFSSAQTSYSLKSRFAAGLSARAYPHAYLLVLNMKKFNFHQSIYWLRFSWSIYATALTAAAVLFFFI